MHTLDWQWMDAGEGSKWPPPHSDTHKLTLTASRIFRSDLVCMVSFWLRTIDACQEGRKSINQLQVVCYLPTFFKTFIANIFPESLPERLRTWNTYAAIRNQYASVLTYSQTHFSVSAFTEDLEKIKVFWTDLFWCSVDCLRSDFQ